MSTCLYCVWAEEESDLDIHMHPQQQLRPKSTWGANRILNQYGRGA